MQNKGVQLYVFDPSTSDRQFPVGGIVPAGESVAQLRVTVFDPGGGGVSAEVGDMGANIATDPGAPTPDKGLNARSLLYAGLAQNNASALPVAAINVGNFSLNVPGFANALGLLTNSQMLAYDGNVDDGTLAGLIAFPNDVDISAGNTVLLSNVFSYAFDGGTDWQRLRTGSAANLSAANTPAPLLTTKPGEWSINHTPAANTQATITRAAGAAGVRHICTSITASGIGLAAAAEASVLVNLRDGASGAGTILWSQRIYIPVGGQNGFTLTGLNIVGSAATAMTLEFAAASGANTFESVALTGYDVI